MGGVRVEVKVELLEWALRRVSAPEKIKQRLPALSDWLKGKKQPTLRQLEEFSKATGTPFGYLLLEEPPVEELPIPFFRTLKGEAVQNPSPDLLQVVQTMQWRQAWMRDYLMEEGAEPLPFVKSKQLSDAPASIAKDIRYTLGLDTAWARNQRTWTEALATLIKKANDIGIIAVVSGIVDNNTHRPLDPQEFRGFVLVDEYAPLIFINGADSKAAQMFTLAHELAHIWLGHSAVFDLKEMQPSADKIERHCDRIAAEFLVPTDEFRKVWLKVQNQENRFQELARHFKVSEIVVARRAFDLNFITKQAFLDFYTHHQKQRIPQSQEGGNFYATQNLRLGKSFAQAVIRAVQKGSLLYREAYRLTGLYGKSFECFIQHISGNSG